MTVGCHFIDSMTQILQLLHKCEIGGKREAVRGVEKETIFSNVKSG